MNAQNVDLSTTDYQDWKLSDLPAPGEHKVFSCFSCGGGSTMGWKLAGFDVIGNCEIDKRINDIYVKNHHPRYNYNIDIRDLLKGDLPKELYGIDVLDGSPPCFESGTLVMTDEGYKNIEDVKVGDFVLTHNGGYKEVYETMSQDAICYEVKVQGIRSFKVTPEHPFLCITMKRDTTLKGKNKRCFSEPYWKVVSDFKVHYNNSRTILEQDYIGIPINTKSELPPWGGIDKTYCLPHGGICVKHENTLDFKNPYFWELVGRYIGDGWLRKTRSWIMLCCAKKEKHEVEDLLNRAGYNCTVSEQASTFRFEIHNQELHMYLLQFGHGVEGKHLTNDVFNLPIDLLKSFLKGYLDADGYFDKRYKTWCCASISKYLIYGVQACIHKAYRQPTTMTLRSKEKQCHVIEGREVKVHDIYGLQFRTEPCKQQHFTIIDDMLYVPFRKKDLGFDKIKVYNLSVKDDESYTVYNLACHNCTTFSVIGHREKALGKKKKFREGQKEQTLDDLFFEFIKVVNALQPKVVVAENVKGLIIGNMRQYVTKIIRHFQDAGYVVQIFLLDAKNMGVPQKRERVFFVARQKSLNWPDIELNFNEPEIFFGKVRSAEGLPIGDGIYKSLLDSMLPGEKRISDMYKRILGKDIGFSDRIIYDDEVSGSLVSSGNLFRYYDKMGFSDHDYRICATFPSDYDFCGKRAQYICGMCVPPKMMYQIASKIKNFWF